MPIFKESGLKVGKLGRIVVDEYLRAESYPFIYGIGDNALAITLARETPSRLQPSSLCNRVGSLRKTFTPM